MNRANIHGRGQALHGDKTTSGAVLISTLQRHATSDRRGIVRRGDPTTTCPKCGKPGVVVEGDPRNRWRGELAAVDGHIVSCGCPYGSNRIIAPLGELSSVPKQSIASSSPNTLEAPPSVESSDFSQQFLIMDEATGTPLPNTNYKITTESGIELQGNTGADGMTQKIFTTCEEEVTIYIYGDTIPSEHNS
ncbi:MULTISPECIES: PAAR domain-containing protein [unclassified Pseudomonas]|uniref:PAAR domain-containing protein n=1 Tax=unclassified Pseudomonas TaxID=196821 RepID=UPI0009E9CB0D